MLFTTAYSTWDGILGVKIQNRCYALLGTFFFAFCMKS
jgi:hypothetical protein